jgi:hypothetical protein
MKHSINFYRQPPAASRQPQAEAKAEAEAADLYLSVHL